MIIRKLLKQLLIVSLAVLKVESYRCERLSSDLIVSEQTKSNNGKYLLEIDGKPEKYAPNEKYESKLHVEETLRKTLGFNKMATDTRHSSSIEIICIIIQHSN